jgi:transcriptional regulator with XRE-family HTH domain
VAADTRLGTRIRKRRQELQLTQEELAERVGVNRSSVTNWERGRHFPQRYLGRVEAVLGVSFAEEEPRPHIPPDLQRALDRLTPAERAYVIERLRRRPGNDENEVPE